MCDKSPDTQPSAETIQEQAIEKTEFALRVNDDGMVEMAAVIPIEWEGELEAVMLTGREALAALDVFCHTIVAELELGGVTDAQSDPAEPE